jgi:hypothetical protein
VTANRGFPLPSLARAARELRTARSAPPGTSSGQDAVLHHRENVELLRDALRVYISALERDGLPVARKLRQELMLLDLVERPPLGAPRSSS